MILPLCGMIRNNNLSELYILKEIKINETKISSYEQIVDLFNKELKMNRLMNEHVYALSLYNDFTPISIGQIAIGSNKSVQIDLSSLFTYLLLSGAEQFIVLHNHTSHTIDESPEDIYLTESIKCSASLLGITFVDHIIIARNGFNIIGKEKVRRDEWEIRRRT